MLGGIAVAGKVNQMQAVVYIKIVQLLGSSRRVWKVLASPFCSVGALIRLDLPTFDRPAKSNFRHIGYG